MSFFNSYDGSSMISADAASHVNFKDKSVSESFHQKQPVSTHKDQDNNPDNVAIEDPFNKRDEDSVLAVNSGFLKKRYSEQEKEGDSSLKPRTDEGARSQQNFNKELSELSSFGLMNMNVRDGGSSLIQSKTSSMKVQFSEDMQASIPKASIHPVNDNQDQISTLIAHDDHGFQDQKGSQKLQGEDDSVSNSKRPTNSKSNYKSSERNESELSEFGSHNVNHGGGSYLSQGGPVSFPARLDEERKSSSPKGQNQSVVSTKEQSSLITRNDQDFDHHKIKETDNIRNLLKMLYTEDDMEEVVLQCLEENQQYIEKFFKTYEERASPIATCLAAFYLALGKKDITRDLFVRRISDPDETEDTTENAGYHRAWYLMRANMKIEEKDITRAWELLTQCRDVPQKYFANVQEDYLDFYAASVGRIYLEERKYKEAEKAFKDALALRLRGGNPRLISASYNDLASLYIQKCKDNKQSAKIYGDTVKEYLDKAKEYEGKFLEAVESDRYDLLSGLVDYKRVDLKKTKKAYEGVTV